MSHLHAKPPRLGPNDNIFGTDVIFGDQAALRAALWAALWSLPMPDAVGGFKGQRTCRMRQGDAKEGGVVAEVVEEGVAFRKAGGRTTASLLYNTRRVQHEARPTTLVKATGREAT